MREGVVIALIIVLVMASAGAGYYIGSTRQPASTETTSAKTTSTLTTTPPLTRNTMMTGGLELKVGANSTSLKVGQRLGITISLFNTLPTLLNLTATVPEANSSYTPQVWQVPGFPVAMWYSCVGVEPVEFMIVSGNQSVAGLHTASAATSIPQGTCMEGGWVNYVSLHPMSSNAEETGVFCTANCHPSSSPFDLVTNFTVNGFWAYPINSSEANDVNTPAQPPCVESGGGVCYTYNYPEVGPIAQHLFISGWYTLVVADEWGQTVLLRFSVG